MRTGLNISKSSVVDIDFSFSISTKEKNRYLMITFHDAVKEDMDARVKLCTPKISISIPAFSLHSIAEVPLNYKRLGSEEMATHLS